MRFNDKSLTGYDSVSKASVGKNEREKETTPRTIVVYRQAVYITDDDGGGTQEEETDSLGRLVPLFDGLLHGVIKKGRHRIHTRRNDTKRK